MSTSALVRQERPSRGAMPRPPRVLAAVAQITRPRLGAILAACSLRWVETSAELFGALGEGGYDLVIVGAHFEESNTVGVLESVFKHPGASRIVCICGTRGQLGSATLKALRLASEVIGVRGFIDFTDCPDDEEGNARLRRRFEALLS